MTIAERIRGFSKQFRTQRVVVGELEGDVSGASVSATGSAVFRTLADWMAGVSDGSLTDYVTPSTDSATYDGQPIAALKVDQAAAPTTRNFVSGIWLITNGGAIDKGRGILLQNLGASDGIYIQCSGDNGTGQAIYLTQAAENATAMVVSTTRSDQLGLVIRQEVALDPAAASLCLLQVQADGAATEMIRVGSDVASQVGIIFRLTGATSSPIVVKDGSDVTVAGISGGGGVFGQVMELEDGITAPNATVGRAKIYVDTADGDLKVKFGDGTVKTIATDT